MQRSVSAISARSVVLVIAAGLLCGAAAAAGQVPELPKIPVAPQTVSRPVQKDQEPLKDLKALTVDRHDKAEKLDDPKPVEAGPELNLGECLGIAMERSPGLRALHATYAATAASSQALNNIGRVGECLAPDLPVRKQQAAVGLRAAAADIRKKEHEITAVVTRLYFTVVYARQQETVTDDVVELVEALLVIARELLKSPKPGDINPGKIALMEIGLLEAKSLRLKARGGSGRAMEALRQAMNVKEADFPFRVKDKELPEFSVKPGLTKEVVMERALAARPEVVLAAAGLDAFRLEVYAQAKIRFASTGRTFASGSDIHARTVPAGSLGSEYRPEPLSPEMPTTLIGSQTDRVNRAMAYCRRAEVMYEDIRNLMALEAANAFVELDTATKKLDLAKQKSKSGNDLAEFTRGVFDTNPNAPKDQLVTGYVAAAKAQADYVEAVFEHLLALAALERITGGTIRAPFPNR